MFKQAEFNFIGNINELLPSDHRSAPSIFHFKGEQSVKHLIESAGIPHTEVGLIMVNGHKINFDYIVQDGDQVVVKPIVVDQKITPIGMPAIPPGDVRFVLDNHLGKLAAYLRMLGIDCLYQNDYQDELLIDLSTNQGRVLLTRDRQLLMRKVVLYGYLLRSKLPKEQLFEVVKRYKLSKQIAPFTRCIRCNGYLQEVSKQDIMDRLEPLTTKYFDQFQICCDCKQIYWHGSHFKRMDQLVAQVSNL